MIECIFTLDYEIYGNGEGSLRELIYKPTEKLKAVFDKWNAPCVVFIEAAELEMIRSEGTDPDIGLVERQIQDLHRSGFEIGLHIHPQWYKARYEASVWQLDNSEYNLCHLSPARVDQIIERSIAYFRRILGVPDFTPLAFRAGNWLLQPAGSAAKSLAAHGIKIDSSVFKGGREHYYKLDYRRAYKNGYYWPFTADVNVSDSFGVLIELPVFTEMVPIWRMFSAKRIVTQKKGLPMSTFFLRRLKRLRDIVRFRYPIKLDFCQLAAADMIRMFEKELDKDRKDPSFYRPIIVIGHTKDLSEVITLDAFLSHLRAQGIPVSSFRDAYARILERDKRP